MQFWCSSLPSLHSPIFFSICSRMSVRQYCSSPCCASFLTYQGYFQLPQGLLPLNPKAGESLALCLWLCDHWFHFKISTCTSGIAQYVDFSYLLVCLGCQVHFTPLVLTFCSPVQLHIGRLRYMFSADVAKEIVVTRSHGCYVVFIDLKSHAKCAHCGSSSITALLVHGVRLSKTMCLARRILNRILRRIFW